MLDAEAAASGGGAGLPVVPSPGGCINTAFVPHGGSTGFFPAPGTNYTVNEEPVIAARLDAVGKALGLHLIGIPATAPRSTRSRSAGSPTTRTRAVRPRILRASKACPRRRSRSSA